MLGLILDGLFLFNEGGGGGGIFGLEILVRAGAAGGIIGAFLALDAKLRIGAGRLG